MKRNTKMGIGIGLLILIAVIVVGVGLNQSANALTMDGNPSIGLNEDATNEKQVIPAEQAKKIALEKVNGTIVEFDFDYDDGRPEYEIEIKANGKEHDIEIDGYTGEITEFEIDDDD
mgnify:CR=1 FL=1